MTGSQCVVSQKIVPRLWTTKRIISPRRTSSGQVRRNALLVLALDFGLPNKPLVVQDRQAHAVAIRMGLVNATRHGNPTVTRHLERADAWSILARVLPILADPSPVGARPERGTIPLLVAITEIAEMVGRAFVRLRLRR